MILVADGGSTKTEWKIISEGIPSESIITSGLNPFFRTGQEIYRHLKKELASLSEKSFSKVFFYGTGCNSLLKENIISGAIEKLLSPRDIFVGSDLLGAALSLCQDAPGIACIIGTGSNSCYYDGSTIVSNVSPLGYILGDEGGGAVIGRKLVSGVLKKQVPAKVIDSFFETYKLTPAEILENVYMKPFPNRFLGQFARFIASNIDIPELQDIITSSFDEFIKRNVLQYPEAKVLPINFTGNIAYHFRPFLVDLLNKNNLRTGIITASPMEELIKYHVTHQYLK